MTLHIAYLHPVDVVLVLKRGTSEVRREEENEACKQNKNQPHQSVPATVASNAPPPTKVRDQCWDLLQLVLEHRWCLLLLGQTAIAVVDSDAAQLERQNHLRRVPHNVGAVELTVVVTATTQ